MGVVVIGGLTVSTFVTLIVVPVLYEIFSRKGERDDQAKLRKTFVFMDINNADYEYLDKEEENMEVVINQNEEQIKS